MESLTNTIRVQVNKEDNLHEYFSEEELEETARELAYIKTHLKEYKENNNWNDLKKELFPNDKI